MGIIVEHRVGLVLHHKHLTVEIDLQLTLEPCNMVFKELVISL